MRLDSIFNQNSDAVLTSVSMNAVKGGKRALEAARAAQDTLISKAGRKTNKILGSNSGEFDFRFEGQMYHATYDADTKMLHVVSPTGEDTCVEW